MPSTDQPTVLLDLATLPLTEVRELVEADDSTLADTMRRLFDPDERERLTVSAFGSAL